VLAVTICTVTIQARTHDAQIQIDSVSEASEQSLHDAQVCASQCLSKLLWFCSTCVCAPQLLHVYVAQFTISFCYTSFTAMLAMSIVACACIIARRYVYTYTYLHVYTNTTAHCQPHSTRMFHVTTLHAVLTVPCYSVLVYTLQITLRNTVYRQSSNVGSAASTVCTRCTCCYRCRHCQ
jgi:hypothetical protein